MKTGMWALFLILFSSSVFAQNEASAPGRLIDVNGYKIHLITSGNEGPPVVMFHGAGDISLIWNLVLPGVSKFGRGIAVDGAGSGWSEHGHGTHMKQQAYDTYTALQNAGIEGPYILVGHSLGGLLTRVFKQMYPDEVAGVILVDATHPDVVLKIRDGDEFKWNRMRLVAKADVIPEAVKTSLLEKPELSSYSPKRDFGSMLDSFSIEDQKRFHWYYNDRPFTYVKGVKSYEAEYMKLMFENEAGYGFGNIPLIVISKGIRREKKGDSNWTSEELKRHSIQLQKELLKLSTDSKQIVAKHSGHHIHIDEPEVVVNAIKEIVAKVERSNSN